jgi:hypothetical protein
MTIKHKMVKQHNTVCQWINEQGTTPASNTELINNNKMKKNN